MERKFENILTPIGAFIGSMLGGMIGRKLTIRYGRKSVNGRVPFLIMGWFIFVGIFNKIGSEIDRHRECKECAYCDDLDDFDTFDDYDDFDDDDFDDDDE